MPDINEADFEFNIVPILISVSKSTRTLMGLKLAEHGFYNGQDELLLALTKSVPISISDVADLLTIRPSTTSKMLDKLEVKGLVRRIGNAEDARKIMVQITLAGLDAKAQVMKLREELAADLKKSWTIDADVAKSLESVAALLRQRLSRFR